LSAATEENSAVLELTYNYVDRNMGGAFGHVR
jgi:hypothetical protein